MDSYFAVLTRVILAGLVFLPLTRWRGVAPEFIATLAVMNNMAVPVGLVLNVLFWGTTTNLLLLGIGIGIGIGIGGLIILASLWINRLGRRAVF